MSLKPGLLYLVLIWIFFLTSQAAFSQSYTSKNNYTGAWETPGSWIPIWTTPQANVFGHDIDINGYITTSGSLSFSGSSKLTVKDTLVIKGNLSINNNNDLKIEDNGILIVWGDLIISYDTHIEANGYLIVTGNIIKIGDVNHGEFKSNDDPVKVFVGGTIPSGLTNHNDKYKALDCTAPNTTPYPNSDCSHGNLTDLINDPIYPFFLSTCSIETPTITAGGPTTFCTGGSVILTSSTGTTYLWSNGATSASINVTASGSYTVRVTNANGCQSSPSVPTIVTVNALPGTATITAGGPTTFCEGGSVILTSSPGNTYLWSNGATTSSINVTMSGSFTVKVTDANGCQSAISAASVVTVNTLPPAPTITAGGTTTFCNGGSVTLTSSAGSTYLWSNGATTSGINVTASGSYTVRTTDVNGCQSSASSVTVVTVNPLPATPTITAGGPTTFCSGGIVTLTSSAGTSYLWSNEATTQAINVTAAGNYTVRVTNADGCQSALSSATVVTVNALPATPVITAGGPTTFCTGGSVALISSPESIYLWSNGATTPTMNVTSSGTYSVRVTNANGCQSMQSVATVVTVNALPATPTIGAGGPTTFCAGGSVTLTSSAGASYLWSNGASTPAINVTTGGSYSVQVTDANGCQSIPSVPTVVTVNSLPLTPTITAGGPTVFCDGSSVTLNSSSGTSYIWSTGATTSGISVSSSGSYSVQVTDANGCQSATSIATVVTVNALPAIPTIGAGGPTTFCTGGSVTLTSSAASSYLWSTGATTRDIIVHSPGSYTVQVTNASGCNSVQSAATVVDVNSLPLVNAGTDETIPNGTSTTLDATVTGTGPFNYSWSPPGLFVNPLIEDPQTVNLPSTTVFTLTATSIATSCSNSSSVTITISGGPLSSTPSASPGTICAGENVQLYANAGGGSGTYTYTWTSTPAGFTSSIADPMVNPVINTTYNVTVFDGFSTANSQIAVTVNDLPATPTITAGGPTTFCAGGSVTLTSSPGTTYIWSTGATSASIDATITGSYTVIATNSNGCQSAVSASAAVTANALPATPTIIAGGPTTFCDGGNITLTSSPGTTYLWSTGATTQSISVTTTGSYSVQVTDANGCQSAPSAATIVTVNASPATPVISASGPATFCTGGSVILTSNPESTYLWSNGAVIPTIDVNASGSYSVRVTNANGCQSASSVATIVTVNNLPPPPTIIAGGPTSFCTGGNVTLTSSIGTGYLWSTGAVTPSINVTSTGSFTVRVTDADGCQSAASSATVITVNSLPFTPIIIAGGPTTFCAGGNVTLTSSVATGYLWSNGATTQSINVTTDGSYTVQVTNANGCQSAPSTATAVTVNTLPATPVIIAAGPTTFCAGGSVILTSGPESTYLWSNGASTQGIIVTTSGNYSVQVTNLNGCQSAPSAATAVIINALPATPTITTGGPTILCAGNSVTLTSSTGTNYLWSNEAITPTINVTYGGSYSVQVTDANGCQSIPSIPTIVTLNSLPVTPIITASGPTAFCAGGSLTLTSSAATSYLWSTGENSQGISVTSSGSYKVQVTNANGCQSSPSVAIVVTVNDLPPQPTITADGPTTFCAGGSVTLTSSPETSYLWSNNSTLQSINVNISGSYTLQTLNINGCRSASSAATFITINPVPVVNITSSNSSMCVSDLRSVTGSPPGGTFSITGGPGTLAGNVLSATGSGQINLEYVYANVCTNKASQSIIVDENVTANAGSDQELEYVFETQMEADLSPYGTGEWSLVSGTGNISDINSPTTSVSELSIGENIFLWKVQNGSCEGTDEVVIEVKDIITPTVITPNEDGLNDVLIFPGLTAFPASTIIIYNRWGSEVYRSTDYKNDWNGKDNKKRDLQEDTYYYVLKISNGRVLKGFIEIIR